MPSSCFRCRDLWRFLAALLLALSPAVAWAGGAAGSLREDQLLLLETQLDGLELTDALQAYQTPDFLMVPAGALSRLLDIDLRVLPGEGRIIGLTGAGKSAFTLEAGRNEVVIGGRRETFKPAEVVIQADDIYLSIELAERLLPVKAHFDSSALALTLEAVEPLPVQERAARQQRSLGLGPASAATEEQLYSVAAPFRLISWPTFDIAAEVAADTRAGGFLRRYDLRSGGDFLGAGLQGWLSSDNRGKPAAMRLLLERRSAQGKLFGMTRVSAGDGFVPALALGPRSVAARGLSFTNRPLDQASIFDRISLRGELPLGHDVELYLNDVLRGSQSAPIGGRYEFPDVALVRGVNVLRLVDYGPHGERSETVRVITVGSGHLARGETVVEVGVGQQDLPLVDLGPSGSERTPGRGDLRAVVSLAHGFSAKVTGALALAAYTPADGVPRRMASLGLRGSVLGFAAQLDAAHDNRRGMALATALSGRLAGVSVTARNAEYRRGFCDETSFSGGTTPLRRSSEAMLDFTLRPWRGAVLPVGLRVALDRMANGRSELTAAMRTSVSLGGSSLSTGLDYARAGTGPGSRRLTGNVSFSTFAASRWQFRSELNYDLKPSVKPKTFTVTVDRSLGEDRALRVGLAQALTGNKETMVEAGLSFRLGGADVTLGGDYSRPQRNWRIGLQVNFSLVRNPFKRRYELRRPGAAGGGNLALQAFIDANANGKRDSGELPAAGVRLSGGSRSETTDAQGRALVTGLGYGASARVAANLEGVDAGDIEAPATTIAFLPGRGEVVTASYPLRPSLVAFAYVRMRRPDGSLVGLSAVRVTLVSAQGETHEGTTEYDGSVAFEGLRPGSYRLALDPRQAARLGMRLASPVSVTVAADGQHGEAEAIVTFLGAQA